MSIDRLGLFGSFGSRSLLPGSARDTSIVRRRDSTDREVLPSIASVCELLKRRGTPSALFVGPWNLDLSASSGKLTHLHAQRTDRDILLYQDSWAWAPESLASISRVRVDISIADQAESGVPAGGSDDSSSAETLIVSSVFLRDLTDPRAVLRAMKIAAFAGQNVLVVHPAETAELNGLSDYGEWLRAYGFTVAIDQLDSAVVVYACSISPESYSDYLKRLGVDPSLLNVVKLLITTEDADVHNTGGIGTYIKNVRALNPTTGTLLCHLDAVQSSMPARTVCPQTLVGTMKTESFFDGLGLVDSVHSLLCLLPKISAVEFQDYRSIGFRLVQAKMTGQLPKWLHLSVFLHGSVDYVKFGVRDDSAVNYGIHELKYAVKDAYIFENVDECVAPSRYLAETLLTKEFGYCLKNLRYVRLPFDLGLIPTTAAPKYQPVKRLVYIGKYNRLKGWQDFVEAVELLAQEDALDAVTEIVSLAPTAPSREDRARINNVKPYRSLHLSHQEMIAFLSEHREDSLIVFPSRGENYPFVVLEQLLAGTLFVAYDAGGAPEVVDNPDFVSRFFSRPNAGALAERISCILSSPVGEHAGLLHDTRNRAVDRQAALNKTWGMATESRPACSSESSLASTGVATEPGETQLPDRHLSDTNVALAIPVYNTPLAFISELLDSILDSKLRPTTVLFVDDGSADDYRLELRALVEGTLSTKFSWTIHEQANTGLAGARNTALSILAEPYIFFIDSDDVLLPNTLQDALIALLIDQKCVAATGFAVYLREPKAPVLNLPDLKNADFWMPLGTDRARALSIFENQYLTANAMIRASTYREIGGWDASDRSMWEDWALYSRLAWEGKSFTIIPAAGYLYRYSSGSMSKTYSRYEGRRRLIRNLPFATPLDANVLYSLVNGAGSERSLLSGPALSEREAELIKFIRSLLNTPRFRRWVLKLYGLYSSLRRRS